jgi:hypothetical protein
MSLSSSSRMSMVGRKLLAVFYLRQYKKIVEKKLIDRPHASLHCLDSPFPRGQQGAPRL